MTEATPGHRRYVVAELVSRIWSVVESRSEARRVWIGLCGSPGSGKTTLGLSLQKEVSASGLECAYIPMDGYHIRLEDLKKMGEEAVLKRGAPYTFEATRFVDDLRKAKGRDRSSFPGFDHARKDPEEDMHHIEPSTRVVICEGNYLLLDSSPWDELAEIFDETWFLHCPMNQLKARLAQRHAEAWNWEIERARERVESYDYLNMELVNRVSPPRATLIIDTSSTT